MGKYGEKTLKTSLNRCNTLFYTGKQVTNSDKRGSTHSIADIEAKRCKNVLEITPKVALKQGFKVVPNLN